MIKEVLKLYQLRKGRKKYKNNEVVIFLMICKPNIPDFYTSLFINNKSKNSFEYGRTLGNRLVKFLNFLFENNVEYWEATDEHIKAFFLKMINFNTKTNEIVGNPSVQYSTLVQYKGAIISFYKFLWQFTDHSVLQIDKWENGKYFQYATPLVLQWKNADKITSATIDLFLTKYKTEEKDYVMQYTEEEITSIYTNFTNYRNRAIFLITLHGMRIDEVLSIKLKDYNPLNNTAKPSRSKGKGRARKRTVVLDDGTMKTIENYILHERNDFEVKSNKHSDYLFVSIVKNIDEYSLKEYTYPAYRNSFMRAAKNAGLINVRTHSGRSHRATELLKIMLDGKIQLTDEIIRHIMGWKSPDSIKPYVEHANKEIAVKFAKEYSDTINVKLKNLESKLFGDNHD
jgi:integrase